MLAHAEFFRSLTLLSSPHLAYALGRSACSLTLSLLPLLHYSALLTSLILSYITLFADYSPPFRHCCCSHRASVWGICAAASPFGFGFDRRLGARAPSSCATRTHGQGQIAAAQSSTGRRGWFLQTRRWRASHSLDLTHAHSACYSVHSPHRHTHACTCALIRTRSHTLSHTHTHTHLAFR